MTLPSSYATVQDVVFRYPPIGSVAVITSGHIAAAIGAEQARIDGMLGGRYQVPFSPVPPVIEMICGDLACLRMVETRVLIVQQTKGAAEWTEVWRKSFTLLEAIAAGKIDITTGSGTTVPQLAGMIGEVWSTSMNRDPIFQGQDFFDVPVTAQQRERLSPPATVDSGPDSPDFEHEIASWPEI